MLIIGADDDATRSETAPVRALPHIVLQLFVLMMLMLLMLLLPLLIAVCLFVYHIHMNVHACCAPAQTPLSPADRFAIYFATRLHARVHDLVPCIIYMLKCSTYQPTLIPFVHCLWSTCNYAKTMCGVLV